MDRFKWPAVVAVALVLGLLIFLAGTGVSSLLSDDEKPAGVSAPTFSNDAEATDQAFLDTVREEILYFTVAPDEALIDAGHEVCSLLESYRPLTTDELVSSVEGFTEGMDGNVTFEETSFFYGAATSSYCPAVYAEIQMLGSAYGI